jgi:hypothetical protein
MNQQINLYQPMFRRQEKVFSAMTMIQTLLLFIGLLVVIYFYGQAQINPLQKQLDKSRSDVVKLRGKVESYRQNAPRQSESKLLQNKIARLEKELEERRRIRDLLDRQQIGNAPRFSAVLEALARQHVQGTWLTEVGISGGGRALSLDGRTLSSRLVPRYVQRLGEEAVMNGIAFNNMEMRQTGKDESGAERRSMSFHISTN